MGTVVRFFLGNFMDFLEFRHQVCFDVHPTGSVNNQQVSTSLAGGVDRIKNQCTGVSTFIPPNDFGADPFSPDTELIDGSRSKGISGSEDNLLPFGKVAMGQFGNRRGFPHTVYPDNQENSQTVLIEMRFR